MTALARQQFLRPRRSRNEVQLPTEINHLQQKGGTYAEILTIGHDRRNACRIRASGTRTRARQRPNLAGTYRCSPKPAQCQAPTFSISQNGPALEIKADNGPIADC